MKVLNSYVNSNCQLHFVCEECRRENYSFAGVNMAT
jgi:hypothetical protein